ncbi:MAG: hypothetical protein ACLRIS_12690 [Flavonifractor plautii]
MELELKRGGRTARVETLGGELVSYRDERGLEYIWGDPAYWPGRNPLLFPIVGMLKEERSALTAGNTPWSATALPGGGSSPRRRGGGLGAPGAAGERRRPWRCIPIPSGWRWSSG